MASQRQNYYTNPAFCQKSEYYPTNEGPTSPRQRALSPERRHPPVGAQKPTQIENNNTPTKNGSFQKSFGNAEEYEEMLVDDSTCSPKKLVEDLQNGNRINTTFINGNETEIIQTKKGRYAIVKVDDDFCEPLQNSKHEYIPMQEQVVKPQKTNQSLPKTHKYTAVPTEDLPQKAQIRPNQSGYPQNESLSTGRYGTIPAEHHNPPNRVQIPNSNSRYAEIPPQGFDSSRNIPRVNPTSPNQGGFSQKVFGSSENLVDNSPIQQNHSRYASIPAQGFGEPRKLVPVQKRRFGSAENLVEGVPRSQNHGRYGEIPPGGFEERVPAQNKQFGSSEMLNGKVPNRQNHGRYGEIPPGGFDERVPLQKKHFGSSEKLDGKVPNRQNHGRYGEIPPGGFEERVPLQKSRFESSEKVPQRQNHGRYAEIPSGGFEETKRNVPIHENSFKRLPVSVPERNHRYEFIPDDEEQVLYRDERYPQTPIKGNKEATQKLHELLITPEKFTKPANSQKVLSPLKKDPFQTPTKSPPKIVSRSQPKAQQKLNYAISTRHNQNLYDKNLRQNTAIIAPICSSPVQSVYSETTFSNHTESWMNLSLGKKPVQATLAVAAIMMILCGGLSSALCFYMVSIIGRMYYLDFGIISGFACLLLGCLGFRGRNCHWLPNRNYISGYIVLSAFSLLTCAGLLVLLFLQPKPGSPLADVTSGAVCGISGLSLILASTGVVASYCCKFPPPDNRVQHAARGFTV